MMVGITENPDVIVDHINGDTLDNRRSNLRILTQGQNVSHRPNMNKNNISGTRGLYCDTHKRWLAAIIHQNMDWWKKSFTDRDEAERQLSIKRAEYNFIHGITTGNIPPRIPELAESHRILDEWIGEHPGSMNAPPTTDARVRYNKRRRDASMAKRELERVRLLVGQ